MEVPHHKSSHTKEVIEDILAIVLLLVAIYLVYTVFVDKSSTQQSTKKSSTQTTSTQSTQQSTKKSSNPTTSTQSTQQSTKKSSTTQNFNLTKVQRNKVLYKSLQQVLGFQKK